MVRSMMQEAEEEAPSGAWSAISAGLDKVAPVGKVPTKRIPMSWIYRTMAGVAVAAGLAAAILIPRKEAAGPIQTQISALSDIPATEPSVTVPVSEEISASSPEEPVQKTTTPAAGIKPSSKSLAQKDLIAQALPSDKEESIPQSRSDTEDIIPTEVPSSPTTEEVPSTAESEAIATKDDDTSRTAIAPVEVSPSETTGESEWNDPFAVMEWEDSHESDHHRLSITAGGNLQSNGDPGQKGGIIGIMRSPGLNTTTTITEIGSSTQFAIPVSVGIGARYYLTNRFAIGLGLSYSYLARTFDGNYREVKDGTVTNSINGDIHHTLQYIGIPLNLYFDILKGDWISLYLSGGGSVEKAIMNKYRIPYTPSDIIYSGPTKGLQYSLSAGGGVQFNLSPFLGLYIDPTIKYYFGDQPRSIRTEQPFTFSIEAGLRFNLGAKK